LRRWFSRARDMIIGFCRPRAEHYFSAVQGLLPLDNH